jgi:thermostable 8-oxoguanine DNA glycosylase
MKAQVIEKRRQPVMTPNGEFKSRQELINRLVADGVLNATDKLREWFKLYPNAYYYIKKNKDTLVYSVEAEREDVLKNDKTIKEFLQIIYYRYKQGKPLFVTEAMKLSSIASPITINRRMARMIRINLIERKFDGVNQYRKYLVPTKISIDHIESNASTQKRARTRSKSSENTDVAKRT